MKVAVSGAMGRLGSVIAHGISNAGDMRLTGVYAPGHAGKIVAGIEIEDSMKNINAQIIVECAHPGVVMGNLKKWHDKGMSVVIGTSGFTEDRIRELKSFWGDDDPGCLIVPNFSIGAALMMRFAEMASAHFSSAEIIERHENTKPDAPSGTALATALRMGKNRSESEQITNDEIVKGARGGLVSGVRAAQAAVETSDVDVFELHDAYTILSALSLEACGFAEPGSGWQLARDGEIGRDGRIPISTFGGLKARGNPAGATGVYQVVEVVQQLRGAAGDCQVADARVGMTQNLGGSGGTAVTHVLTVDS